MCQKHWPQFSSVQFDIGNIGCTGGWRHTGWDLRQKMHSWRSGNSVPQSINHTGVSQKALLEPLIDHIWSLYSHANLTLCQIFYLLNFDPNQIPSWGIIPDTKRS